MITLNFVNMLSDSIEEEGITKSDIESLKDKIDNAHQMIVKRAKRGLSFLDLPKQDISKIRQSAKKIRDSYENFILLGIGGSALGPKCILEALSPMHNLRNTPRVFIYDNVDPMTLKTMLSIVDTSKTAINVITKSGTTAETMASFMTLYDIVKKADNFIATTDPEKGDLRKISTELGFTTLPIPPDVGGRYSVLSPVGLLLAEVIGIDSEELLRGAEDVKNTCSLPDIWKNPAYMFGTLLYAMDIKKGRKINILMPYSDRLKVLSEWFCQLWAESLGKDGFGLTPYPSLGTTDQHSQLQLWMDGPKDKVVIFIKVQDHRAEITIPKIFKEFACAYLGGHTLSELINAEEQSTELCLKKVKRPNMTINLPYIDAYYLGGLFFFFELATAFTGFLYGIDPFDQPAVEMGKKFTYAMMGRAGYEDMKKEVESSKGQGTIPC